MTTAITTNYASVKMQCSIPSAQRLLTLPFLMDLFARLESADPEIVENAKLDLESLKAEHFTLDALIESSLPCSPMNVEALQTIALTSLKSSDSILQQRAFQACNYLVSNSPEQGYKMASDLAFTLMRSDDEHLQKRGVQYFTLLFKEKHPIVSKADLILAIEIAKNACATEESSITTRPFFEQLVKHGRADDVLQLSSVLPGLFSSKHFREAFVGIITCGQIAIDCPAAIAVPLEAATLACASKDPKTQHEGWMLFQHLLHFLPKQTIDPLLKILEASPPGMSMLLILKQLAGHQFPPLTTRTQRAVLERATNDALALMSILTKFDTCSSDHLKREAQRLMGLVQARLPQD